MANIKLSGFNVRGLLNSEKRRTVFQYFKENKIDLVFLQGTHSKAELENSWKHKWTRDGHIEFSHSNTQGGGTLCLMKNKLKITSESIIHGQMQKLKLLINNNKITIYNIHAPNTDKDQQIFFENLKSNIANDQGYDFLILAGDFNVVRNFQLDKQNGNVQKRKSHKILNEILDLFNLEDIWRKLNPKKKMFTWSKNNPKIECRLDFFFISKSLKNNVTRAEIDHLKVKSDHRPIYLDFDSMKPKRGPGYWKFNNSLLLNEEFCKEMNTLIETSWTEHFGDR